MDDRRNSWTPAGQAERYDPLPGFLLLPARGWRTLSPRGRRIVAALALAGLAAIAVAWPQVQRDRRAGEAERAAAAAESRAHSLRVLREDQRPRRAVLPPSLRARLSPGEGLESPVTAGLVAARLDSAITRDLRARIAAGKLGGAPAARPAATRSGTVAGSAPTTTASSSPTAPDRATACSSPATASAPARSCRRERSPGARRTHARCTPRATCSRFRSRPTAASPAAPRPRRAPRGC